MKSLLVAISVLVTLLIFNPLLVNAQNSTNNTGGLSSESVDQANSNLTAESQNTTDSSNSSGGLSSESVTQSQY